MISNKAIVASIGCITIGLVAWILNNGDCLWSLFLLCLIVDETN